jgi:hypothetical protein
VGTFPVNHVVIRHVVYPPLFDDVFNDIVSSRWVFWSMFDVIVTWTRDGIDSGNS